MLLAMASDDYGGEDGDAVNLQRHHSEFEVERDKMQRENVQCTQCKLTITPADTCDFAYIRIMNDKKQEEKTRRWTKEKQDEKKR